MPLRIDHVTIAGGDLEELRSRFAAAGIDTVYGGVHQDGITEMAVAAFADGSYLELIAPCRGAARELVEAHVWGRFLVSDGGPCAWAIRSPHLAADLDTLRQRGVAASCPARSGRVRPDGVRLEWQTSDLGTGPRGAFLPFAIEDLTPRELRAYPPGSAARLPGISRIVLAVGDLEDAVAQLRQAFTLPEGARNFDADFGAALASWSEVPVVLAEPIAGSPLAVRLERFGPAPCAFVWGLRGGEWKSSVRWLTTGSGWRTGIESLNDHTY